MAKTGQGQQQAKRVALGERGFSAANRGERPAWLIGLQIEYRSERGLDVKKKICEG
jgi:hypothetical protein